MPRRTPAQTVADPTVSEQAVTPTPAATEDASPAPVEAATTPKGATTATVLTDQGAHIRTYTKEVHGDDFHDNAKEFAAHTPGSTIVLS